MAVHVRTRLVNDEYASTAAYTLVAVDEVLVMM
jgi:hypothetical protein